MHELKKWLVAIDITKHDENMLNYLKGLSQALLPDEITLLHVMRQTQLPESSFGSKEDKETYLKDHEKRIREELNSRIEKYFGNRSDLKVELQIIHDNVLSGLLDFARDYQQDLLVVGKKKRTGGSGVVAQKLARRVDSSILFVTEHARYPVKKVLVPVDYSKNAKRAFRFALNIHPLLEDPQIHCMHVYEVPPGLAIQIGRTPDQFDQIIRQNAEEAMDKFMKDEEIEHVDIEKVLVKTKRSNPARQVMDYAEINHINLILLGARGHTMLETLLMGSTAEKILQYDYDVPIIIIR